MAEVSKTGTPTLSTAVPSSEHQITGLVAGEALAGGDAVFIHTDGLVYQADGSAFDAEAVVVGFVATACSANEACTIYFGVNFGYGPHVSGTPVDPGAPLYLSGTVPGGLADAPSTGGVAPIAFAIGDGRIYARGNWLGGVSRDTDT